MVQTKVRRWRAFVSGALALFAVDARSIAQCAPFFTPAPGAGVPGVDGSVYASVLWDPDGAGPATPLWIVGGDFLVAGDILANNIAAYDPATGSWVALGTGLNANVRSLAVAATGELIAGGYFGGSGNVTANCVASWNGSAWSSMGGGLNGGVFDLATAANGDVIAAGPFTIANGAPANGIARWNGSSWLPFGSGIASGVVYAVQPLPNGDVVAGGYFTQAGSIACTNIARWNGTAWSAVGALAAGVDALARLGNNDVVASSGGQLTRWTGSAWQGFGAPLANAVPLQLLPNGDLLASSDLGLVRGSGAAWTTVAPGIAGVQAVAQLANGELLASGVFTTAGGVTVLGAARWSGTAWSALTPGFAANARVTMFGMTTLANGELVIGGNFTVAGGVPAARVARWTGTAWASLGSGLAGANSFDACYALAALPDGSLVAGGLFDSAGGVPAASIARWDGVAWSPLGAGVGIQPPPFGSRGQVAALAVLPNGDVIAGGHFTLAGGNPANSIARWDGATWSPLGSGVLGIGGGTADVFALAVLTNGDLVAAGSFATAGGVAVDGIASWNGSAWAPLGPVTGSSVGAVLQRLANGDLVAVRNGGIERWRGGAWTSIGVPQGFVQAMAELPDGDLLIGGSFTAVNGVAAESVARWDGSAWSAVDGGLPFAQRVRTMQAWPAGGMLLGGDIVQLANGQPSRALALLLPSCPAAAIVGGNGCVGAGGLNALRAESLPWIGGRCTTRATGLPPNGLALRVLGTATSSIPLASLLPQGGPGCTLLATPDVITFHVPSGGRLTTSIDVPRALALVGFVLHEQVAGLEFTPQGAIALVTTTERLALTIGAL